jgi:hypothetical protein
MTGAQTHKFIRKEHLIPLLRVTMVNLVINTAPYKPGFAWFHFLLWW